MTHDRIIVTLPFERSFGPFKFVRKREVGFLFTNLYKHLFAIHTGLESHDQLQKRVEDQGMEKLIEDTIFCAAQSYVGIFKRIPFSQAAIVKAFNSADSETKKKVLDVWQKSQTFGATVKKKQVVKNPKR